MPGTVDQGENSISKPGIRVNTETRLNRMDLISTMAMSKPMPNRMNPSAARPHTVVREEALISGIALDRASMQASRVDLYSCSSENGGTG